jgi:hypothetical protein
LTLKIIGCYIRWQGLVTFPIRLSLTLVSSPREVAGALGGAGFFTGKFATRRSKTVVSSIEFKY